MYLSNNQILFYIHTFIFYRHSLTKKLMNLVDCLSGPEISNNRNTSENALLSLYQGKY